MDSVASYLPATIMEYLRDHSDGDTPATSPFKRDFQTAVLFADVSGYTALCEALAEYGPEGDEMLAEHLNSYFGQLVKTIASQGGDVFKFAGDAIVVLWPPTDDLVTATRRASQCALEIGEKLQAVQLTQKISLSVKVGVGVGTISVLHVGGVYNRMEYIATGGPLIQAYEAEHHAASNKDKLKEAKELNVVEKLKEQSREMVYCSPEVWALVKPYFRAQVGADKFANLIECTDPLRKVSLKPSHQAVAELSPNVLQNVNNYVPSAVRRFVDTQEEKWAGELRRITVLFVNVGMNRKDLEDLKAVQEVLTTVQRAVYRYEGSLNKFLLDDKGSTLLAAFGLPPLAHEDDAVRGVLSAIYICAKLNDLGLKPSIGITTGSAYCGVIGPRARREYSILGDTVNLAARLMQFVIHEFVSEGGGVLCDTHTSYAARTRVFFEYKGAIKVKGKAKPVKVWQPEPKFLTKSTRPAVSTSESLHPDGEDGSGMSVSEPPSPVSGATFAMPHTPHTPHSTLSASTHTPSPPSPSSTPITPTHSTEKFPPQSPLAAKGAAAFVSPTKITTKGGKESKEDKGKPPVYHPAIRSVVDVIRVKDKDDKERSESPPSPTRDLRAPTFHSKRLMSQIRHFKDKDYKQEHFKRVQEERTKRVHSDAQPPKDSITVARDRGRSDVPETSETKKPPSSMTAVLTTIGENENGVTDTLIPHTRSKIQRRTLWARKNSAQPPETEIKRKKSGHTLSLGTVSLQAVMSPQKEKEGKEGKEDEKSEPEKPKEPPRLRRRWSTGDAHHIRLAPIKGLGRAKVFLPEDKSITLSLFPIDTVADLRKEIFKQASDVLPGDKPSWCIWVQNEQTQEKLADDLKLSHLPQSWLRFPPVQSHRKATDPASKYIVTFCVIKEGQTPEYDQMRRHREVLVDKINTLTTTGGGGIVIIEGDIGLGKSRLLAEAIANRKSVICGAGNPFEMNRHFSVWRDIFLQIIDTEIANNPDIYTDSSENNRANLIKSKLSLIPLSGSDTHDSLVLLAPVLNEVLQVDFPETPLVHDMDETTRLQQAHLLLLHLMQIFAQQSPIIAVIDDAVFLDPGSWGLVLAATREVKKLLLILSTRPINKSYMAAFSDAPPPEYLELLNDPRTILITLKRRSDEVIYQIACESIGKGVKELPPEMRTLITRKAHGNPLVVKELVYALRKSRIIKIENGTCTVVGDWKKIRLPVPNTLESALGSRFDRLTHIQKMIIKVGAVIGEEFTYELLERSYPLKLNKDESLERELINLVDLNVVMHAPSHDEGKCYTFTNGYMRDLLLSKMLRDQKQRLKAAVDDSREHGIRRKSKMISVHPASLAAYLSFKKFVPTQSQTQTQIQIQTQDWDKRWFAIHQDLLAYWLSEEDYKSADKEKKQLGILFLKNANLLPDPTKDFTFQITCKNWIDHGEVNTGSRTFNLSANDKQDYLKWTETIRATIAQAEGKILLQGSDGGGSLELAETAPTPSAEERRNWDDQFLKALDTPIPNVILKAQLDIKKQGKHVFSGDWKKRWVTLTDNPPLVWFHKKDVFSSRDTTVLTPDRSGAVRKGQRRRELPTQAMNLAVGRPSAFLIGPDTVQKTFECFRIECDFWMKKKPTWQRRKVILGASSLKVAADWVRAIRNVIERHNPKVSAKKHSLKGGPPLTSRAQPTPATGGAKARRGRSASWGSMDVNTSAALKKLMAEEKPLEPLDSSPHPPASPTSASSTSDKSQSPTLKKTDSAGSLKESLPHIEEDEDDDSDSSNEEEGSSSGSGRSLSKHKKKSKKASTGSHDDSGSGHGGSGSGSGSGGAAGGSGSPSLTGSDSGSFGLAPSTGSGGSGGHSGSGGGSGSTRAWSTDEEPTGKARSTSTPAYNGMNSNSRNRKTSSPATNPIQRTVNGTDRPLFLALADVDENTTLDAPPGASAQLLSQITQALEICEKQGGIPDVVRNALSNVQKSLTTTTIPGRVATSSTPSPTLASGTLKTTPRPSFFDMVKKVDLDETTKSWLAQNYTRESVSLSPSASPVLQHKQLEDFDFKKGITLASTKSVQVASLSPTPTEGIKEKEKEKEKDSDPRDKDDYARLPDLRKIKKREGADDTLTKSLALDIGDITKWEWDVFAIDKSNLTCVVAQIFQRLDFFKAFKIQPSTFVTWVHAVQDNYFPMPFHNFYHAVDITQTVFCTLISLGGGVHLKLSEKFAVVVAALCHDIRHPGMGNSFHVNAQTSLAEIYNDQSVLEHHHCASAFRVLSHPDCNILSYFNKQEYSTVRKHIINSILATDMTIHFTLLEKFNTFLEEKDEARKLKKQDKDAKQDTEEVELGTDAERETILNIILHSSDISNPCKPWENAKRLADAVLQEFFQQGDVEKSKGLPVSPNTDRNTTSQAQLNLNFIDFIVAPIFVSLRQLLPKVEVCMTNLKKNRGDWNQICLKDIESSSKTTPEKDQEKARWERRMESFHEILLSAVDDEGGSGDGDKPFRKSASFLRHHHHHATPPAPKVSLSSSASATSTTTSSSSSSGSSSSSSSSDASSSASSSATKSSSSARSSAVVITASQTPKHTSVGLSDSSTPTISTSSEINVDETRPASFRTSRRSSLLALEQFIEANSKQGRVPSPSPSPSKLISIFPSAVTATPVPATGGP